LFAPVNSAISALPPYQVNYLLDSRNINSLNSVLTYHVLDTASTTASFANGEALPTVQGSNLFVTINGSGYLINDVTCSMADIVVPNIQLSNGVIQMVSEVFVPFGAFCPDVIYAAEQRNTGRISSYGYDCRSKGVHHLTANQLKPVGLAVDSSAKKLFWSNDENYPFGQPTSWITDMDTDGTGLTEWTHDLIDPQGLDTDTVAKKVYYTEHQGNTLSRANYDGSQAEVIIQRKGDVNFQPSDVAVDSEHQFLFLATEGVNYVNGTLYQLDYQGTVLKELATGTIKNYGLCVDTYHQHVFYIQGGHGGQINCVAYGSTPCKNSVLVDILEYPYMCDVDTTWAPYGGPTRVAFTQANIPGQVYYVNTDGTDKTLLNTVSTDLAAPMGVKFGCTV